MDFPMAIWAGPTALSAKFAAAIAMSIVMLSIIDRRSTIWLVQAVLALAAALCGFWTTSNCVGAYGWSWTATSICFLMLSLTMLRNWASVRPAQRFEEEVVANRLSQSSNRKTRSKAVADPPTDLANYLRSIWPQSILAVLTNVLLLVAIFTATYQGNSVRLTCLVHNFAITLALAISVTSAIELTFVTVPQANAAVKWSQLSWTAVGCWSLDLLCLLPILFWFDDPQRENQEIIIGAIFSLSMMLIFAIVWFIPYRLSRNPTGQTRLDWISLALASWIIALCLAVVALLPYRWPWIMN